MITLKTSGDHIITITGRNLAVFEFLGDRIMPVQNHKPRNVNYNLILMNYEEHD